MWTRHLAVWTVLCLRQQVCRYESWRCFLVCYDQDLQKRVTDTHVLLCLVSNTFQVLALSTCQIGRGFWIRIAHLRGSGRHVH